MNVLPCRITVVALGALGLAACGGGGSAPGADPFLGTYDYMENHTLTITSPMMSPPMAGTAAGKLTIAAGPSAGYLVTIESPANSGGGSCALTATGENETSLTFALGQTCAVSGMGSTGTATLTSGSGELSGSTLTLDLAYDIAGTSPMGSFTATNVDHDTATRQ
jgi:hypothetical protein